MRSFKERPWHHRYDLEIQASLLALCDGNHRTLVDSPPKLSVTRALMFPLMLPLPNGWTNTRIANDLKHHDAHYEITVITTLPLTPCALLVACNWLFAMFYGFGSLVYWNVWKFTEWKYNILNHWGASGDDRLNTAQCGETWRWQMLLIALIRLPSYWLHIDTCSMYYTNQH